MSLEHDYHYFSSDESTRWRNCFNAGFISQPASSPSSSSSPPPPSHPRPRDASLHVSVRVSKYFFRRLSARESKRRFHWPSYILIGASLLPLLLLISFVSLLSSRGRSRSRSGRFVHRESPNFTWSAAGSVSFGSSGTRSSGRVGRLLQSYAAAAAGPKPRLERWLFWKDPSPWRSPGGVYRQPEGSCPSSRAPTPDTMEIVIIFVFFGPEGSRNVKLYFYLAECS